MTIQASPKTVATSIIFGIGLTLSFSSTAIANEIEEQTFQSPTIQKTEGVWPSTITNESRPTRFRANTFGNVNSVTLIDSDKPVRWSTAEQEADATSLQGDSKASGFTIRLNPDTK